MESNLYYMLEEFAFRLRVKFVGYLIQSGGFTRPNNNMEGCGCS